MGCEESKSGLLARTGFKRVYLTLRAEASRNLNSDLYHSPLIGTVRRLGRILLLIACYVDAF